MNRISILCNTKRIATQFYVLMALSLIVFPGCEDQLFSNGSDDPRYVFDSFWREVDRHYSFFDRVSADWDSVYQVYKAKVKPSTTNNELFQIFDDVLNLLNDAHTNVYAPMGVGGNNGYFDAYRINPILADPNGPYFDFYNNINRPFGFGKLKNSNLAYLRIKTFEGTRADFEEIDDILKTMEWSTALIIDVRSNMGGQISNSEIVASRFLDSTTPAYEYRLRNGQHHSDFTPWYKVNITPSAKKTWTNKPVAVLTNRGSFSATEWFVLFMQLQPRTKVVGDTTGGGGAVPIARELPNGWILRVSNTQTKLTSGKIFQQTGIYPNIPVWITKEDEQNGIDTILETAITHLK